MIVDELDQVQVSESFIKNLTSHVNEALATEPTTLDTAKQQLKKELATIQAKEERLIDAIADGLLTKETAAKR